MFSGSITVLVFVAVFSSGVSVQSSTVPVPAPGSTIAPSATKTVQPQQTMTPPMTSAEPTSPTASGTTEPPEMKPSCAKITFTAKMAWNASFGESQSMVYNDSVMTLSIVLRNVFNDALKYDDVKVTEVTFNEKEGQVQVKAKLCLVVKADGVYIEEVFKAKVKSGKLHDMFEVMPDSAEFEAEGVTFKDWKAKECKICIDGGGGEFVIEGTCTPTENSCKGLKNTKMSKDCENYCSAASITTVSFLILALGILLSFSFQ